MQVRTCLKHGWRGQPAHRNGSGYRNENAAGIVRRCRTDSVQQVAGRHSLVACATPSRYFRGLSIPLNHSATARERKSAELNLQLGILNWLGAIAVKRQECRVPIP